MGCFGKSIPWNPRPIPWISPSKACFQREIGADLCHIASLFHVLGAQTAEHRRDMPENQTFPIFAYLQPKERACENNQFSVLKTRGADKVMGHSARRRSPPREKRDHPWRDIRPERERRDESRLYAADIAPHGHPFPAAGPSARQGRASLRCFAADIKKEAPGYRNPGAS